MERSDDISTAFYGRTARAARHTFAAAGPAAPHCAHHRMPRCARRCAALPPRTHNRGLLLTYYLTLLPACSDLPIITGRDFCRWCLGSDSNACLLRDLATDLLPPERLFFMPLPYSMLPPGFRPTGYVCPWFFAIHRCSTYTMFIHLASPLPPAFSTFYRGDHHILSDNPPFPTFYQRMCGFCRLPYLQFAIDVVYQHPRHTFYTAQTVTVPSVS